MRSSVRIAPFEHFHLQYRGYLPSNHAPAGSSTGTSSTRMVKCEEFDPRLKPRSLMSHDGTALIHLYLYDGHGKKPFGLNGLRVLGPNAVRLCYKPVQEDNGDWETSEPSGTTSPGIWLCWDQLGPGTWDLFRVTPDMSPR